MAVKVCLDAGHYGKYNRSPAVSSYYESDMTWKLHNYLKKELEPLIYRCGKVHKDKQDELYQAKEVRFQGL